MLDLNESINVWVFFKQKGIEPYLFIWRNRRIKIDTINLMHTTKDGDVPIYHFSVSAQNNFYRLRFNTKTLQWFLEEVEEDN